MNKDVLFSIVIPTYNRAKLLKRCLDSVEAQTYKNWEAIVVDNYSDDNTEEVVKAFNDERIKYIKNHNYGVIAISRNKALDVAKGDWVAFLDSDDCWVDKKLESVLPYLDEYDLVYHGYIQNIPKRNLWHKRKRYFYEIKEVRVGYVLQRGDPINPSCTCVRRSSIGETRFSEDRELIAVEDYDFFLQLIAKGIRIKYIKKVYTLYDVSGCSHDENASERDRIIFEKWDSFINDEEKKEIEIRYLIRKVDYILSKGDFQEAKRFYLKIIKSRMLTVKIFAIKGLIKCLLKINRIF
jgi:glycosyltransferase involved in cell wall biosynthesis